MMALFEHLTESYRQLHQDGSLPATQRGVFGRFINAMGVPETLALAEAYRVE